MSLTDDQSIKERPSALTLYLQNQRAGGKFDSTDDFGLDPKLAREKFGRYASFRPSAWILRFVQFANEAGCSDLFITQERGQTSVSVPPTRGIEMEVLKGAFDRFQADNLVEQHFIGAVVGLQSLGGEVFLEQGRRLWVPGSDDIEPEDGRHFEGLRCVFRPPSLTFWQALKSRLTRQVSLLDEIHNYCYASRVNIHLDSRLYELDRPGTILLASTVPGDPVVALDIAQPLAQKRAPFSDWMSEECKSVAYAVWCEVVEKLPREGNLSIDWCRSGVVVKREAMFVKQAPDLVATALAPTENLKFDITGLDFQDDARSERRRRKGSNYLTRGLREVFQLSLSGKHWDHFAEESRTGLSRDHLERQLLALIGEVQELDD